MPASLCVFKQCPIQVLTKPKVAYLECTDGNWCFQHGKATGLVLECSFSRFSVSNDWIFVSLLLFSLSIKSQSPLVSYHNSYQLFLCILNWGAHQCTFCCHSTPKQCFEETAYGEITACVRKRLRQRWLKFISPQGPTHDISSSRKDWLSRLSRTFFGSWKSSLFKLYSAKFSNKQCDKSYHKDWDDHFRTKLAVKA